MRVPDITSPQQKKEIEGLLKTLENNFEITKKSLHVLDEVLNMKHSIKYVRNSY